MVQPLCPNQATHFVGCTKSLNAENCYCNCKKIGTTFDAGPTVCISFANKGKTQIGWATIIGQRT